jgi:hypothetical protein
MGLPRMTTRRWMLVVVVVALLMGGAIGGYRMRAEYYSNLGGTPDSAREASRGKLTVSTRSVGL